MNRHVSNIILGQGLAGSAVAWTLHWFGQSVVLMDRGQPNTASRVAAGLVTPVTGRRLVKSADFDDYWAAATAFYRRVENITGRHLFAERDMIRLFSDRAARAEYRTRSVEQGQDPAGDWEGTLQQGGPDHVGVRIGPAGRLNVIEYLEATRKYFEGLSGYLQVEASLPEDFAVEESVVRADRFGLTADRLILCQGAEISDWFPQVPNNPSRGDLLTVRIRNYDRPEVVHRAIWIAPNQDGTQTVGATYDWNFADSEPTHKGRQELLVKLNALTTGTVDVEQHLSAIRPTMKDYEPMVGQHPEHARLFILNGLGSKGTLRSPRLAEELGAIMIQGSAPVPEHSYARLSAGSEITAKPLTQQAQEAVADVVSRGDVVIDATVGNGFDTAFLSQAVGSSGRVIGFDVQSAAIEATHRRLIANGLTNVTLNQAGHETMSTSAAEGTIAAVMFNLGFLPRSDRTIVTQPDTTTTAIQAAIRLLTTNGRLTVLCYRGHPGGEEEYEAVECLLSSYADGLHLRRIDSTPPKPQSPVLFVLTKT